MKFLLTLAPFLCFSYSQAQIAERSIVPDFTITDVDGFDHNLYSYLDLEYLWYCTSTLFEIRPLQAH